MSGGSNRVASTIIGIGAGDPDYLVVQAIEALNDTQVFFAVDKGELDNDLVKLRREIYAWFIRTVWLYDSSSCRPRSGQPMPITGKKSLIGTHREHGSGLRRSSPN